MDEVALYDVPKLIDFVLETTARTSLFYAGFSQGNMAAFAMLAELPEYNTKVGLSHNLVVRRTRMRQNLFINNSDVDSVSQKFIDIQVRLMAAIAPVCNMTYIRSPARFLTPFSEVLTLGSNVISNGALLTVSPTRKRLMYSFCETPWRFLCGLPTFFMFGVSLKHLNQVCKLTTTCPT